MAAVKRKIKRRAKPRGALEKLREQLAHAYRQRDAARRIAAIEWVKSRAAITSGSALYREPEAAAHYLGRMFGMEISEARRLINWPADALHGVMPAFEGAYEGAPSR